MLLRYFMPVLLAGSCIHLPATAIPTYYQPRCDRPREQHASETPSPPQPAVSLCPFPLPITTASGQHMPAADYSLPTTSVQQGAPNLSCPSPAPVGTLWPPGGNPGRWGEMPGSLSHTPHLERWRKPITMAGLVQGEGDAWVLNFCLCPKTNKQGHYSGARLRIHPKNSGSTPPPRDEFLSPVMVLQRLLWLS